jgi:hypothetical protein
MHCSLADPVPARHVCLSLLRNLWRAECEPWDLLVFQDSWNCLHLIFCQRLMPYDPLSPASLLVRAGRRATGQCSRQCVCLHIIPLRHFFAALGRGKAPSLRLSWDTVWVLIWHDLALVVIGSHIAKPICGCIFSFWSRATLIL